MIVYRDKKTGRFAHKRKWKRGLRSKKRRFVRQIIKPKRIVKKRRFVRQIIKPKRILWLVTFQYNPKKKSKLSISADLLIPAPKATTEDMDDEELAIVLGDIAESELPKKWKWLAN